MQESQEAAALEALSKKVNEMTQDEGDTAAAEALCREMNKFIEEIKNQSKRSYVAMEQKTPTKFVEILGDEASHYHVEGT
uniref:Uncharacterized protein n=1 Tax=Ditylenchus dipsaci TaxID=166011 RepID=A0A915EBZ7_9BILA